MKIEITINSRQSKKALAKQEQRKERMENVLMNFKREVDASPELTEFYADENMVIIELNRRLAALDEMEKEADKMAGNAIQRLEYKFYTFTNKKVGVKNS